MIILASLNRGMSMVEYMLEQEGLRKSDIQLALMAMKATDEEIPERGLTNSIRYALAKIMNLKPNVWACSKCDAVYTEDSSQVVDSGVTKWTLRNLTDFIDKHYKETGHKEFNLA